MNWCLSLALSDLNQDGLLDIVSINSGLSTVTGFLQTSPGRSPP